MMEMETAHRVGRSSNPSMRSDNQRQSSVSVLVSAMSRASEEDICTLYHCHHNLNTKEMVVYNRVSCMSLSDHSLYSPIQNCMCS